MFSDVALHERIEHTLLSSTASASAIDVLCDEALAHEFFGVCVQPIHVARAVMRLAGSGCRVVTVVGFPLGVHLTATKVAEASAVVAAGAHELDMVLRVDGVLAGDWKLVANDISAVVAAAADCPVKVILETGYLDAAQIDGACRCAVDAGARFVKTSTGFGPRGASVEDIQRMRAAVGPDIGVKASGGIRTRAQAEALVAAGADRLGTSAGVAIVAEAAGDAGGAGGGP